MTQRYVLFYIPSFHGSGESETELFMLTTVFDARVMFPTFPSEDVLQFDANFRTSD